jgi:hypothetical protein|tara:strand:+ start:122 stop:370 length:249 start_codon:yes stop_codon:yes gene_type:complete
MADFSNTSWVEQSTGLTIVIGPVQIETRSCVISVGPTTFADVDFRIYLIEGVEGAKLFATAAAFDESGLDSYVVRGLLIPVP